MKPFKSNAAYQRRQGGLSDTQSKLLADSLYHIDQEQLITKTRTLDPNCSRILEIGFGTGDHLLNQAKDHPNAFVVGIDLYRLGAASLLQKSQHHDIRNLWTMTIDAYQLLSTTPDPLHSCFDFLYILHPDPWPKKRHHKRRLINEATLQGAYALLRPGGCIRILSDESSYTEAITTLTQKLFPTQHTLHHPCPPQTKYGEKALEEGRIITSIEITKPLPDGL